MKVYDAVDAYNLGLSVLALGNFDGVHVAHREILEKCKGYAAKNGLKSGVLLFCNHTETVITNKQIHLLTTLSEKLKLIEAVGLDFAVVLPFDAQFRKMSPKGFLQFLIEHMHMRAVSVGYDYRFGYQAQGDVALLKQCAKDFGFSVIQTDVVLYRGEAVSSTMIRTLLEQGCITEANALLERNYTISGTVQNGLQNGRKMGIPTANLSCDAEKLLLGDGVYKGMTYIGGKAYRSLINIGKNPTFGAENRTVESHILDFNGDVYGAEITLSFEEKIRNEKTFDTIEQLQQQILSDIKRVKGDM